jgi:hypothetical protein
MWVLFSDFHTFPLHDESSGYSFMTANAALLKMSLINLSLNVTVEVGHWLSL